MRPTAWVGLSVTSHNWQNRAHGSLGALLRPPLFCPPFSTLPFGLCLLSVTWIFVLECFRLPKRFHLRSDYSTLLISSPGLSFSKCNTVR